MITLRELSSWERRIGEIVRRQTGSLEEREQALVLQGVYAEYGAVFRSYVQLISEDDSGLEALKRATFLVWYDAVEPACLTGIGELPETDVRLTLESLDRRCRASPVDAELQFMIPFDVSVAPFGIARVPGMANVEALAGSVREPAKHLPRDARDFQGRGLMGEYWSALIDRAR